VIAAIDTNVLLDILIPDETYLPSSKKVLDEYFRSGQLIISEIVYAELASQFPSHKELMDFFADTHIRLIHSNEKTLHLAGERWKLYVKKRRLQLQCPQCGHEQAVICPECHYPIAIRNRILGDFIIGAHALVNADLLLSRDRGFYRTYFKDLRIG